MKNTINALIKERIAKYGVSTLLPAEIISILTGANIDVIKNAITEFGLLDYSNYLESFELTEKQSHNIKLLNELFHQITLASHLPKIKLSSSDNSGKYCIDLLSNNADESFYLLCLNSSNHLNRAVQINTGSVNEVSINVRFVVECALKYKATSVILTHNHPGGTMRPSSADKDVTTRLKDALRTVQINVIDHVIVSSTDFYSMAEHGEV